MAYLSSVLPAHLTYNHFLCGTIGAKTAQRIILELKDKFKKDTLTEVGNNTYAAHNTNRSEALSALITLGFARNVAEKTLDTIVKRDGSNLSVEDLIKKALKTS